MLQKIDDVYKMEYRFKGLFIIYFQDSLSATVSYFHFIKTGIFTYI